MVTIETWILVIVLMNGQVYSKPGFESEAACKMHWHVEILRSFPAAWKSARCLPMKETGT